MYKDGSIEYRSNYRPISVLPVVARLFEKLIYEQLYSYVNENNILLSQTRQGFDLTITS